MRKLSEEKMKAECERTEALYEYEKKYSSYKYICGIDEVGRGPYAGPVIAAAVILPKDEKILFLNDSKKLSEKKREELFDIINEKALAVGIGRVDPEEIDKINILQATYKAMQTAISKLKIVPDILLNDAVTIPEISIKQIPLVHGDALSASIAAASIIAKVTRDRIMCEYDIKYPAYLFAKNKGYGTREHEKAIYTPGLSAIHRKSFCKKFLQEKNGE